jgi:exopolysaccharide biosynthesis polyprenyl glycosylphosphotransferase
MDAVETIEPVAALPDAESPEPSALNAAVRAATPRSWLDLCVAVDAFMLAAAALMERLATDLAGTAPTPPAWLLAMPVLTFWLLSARGLYRRRLRLQLVDDVRLILGASSVVAMAIVTTRIMAGGDTSVAAQTIHQWLFSLVYLAAGRIGLSVALTRARRTRDISVATLIVGAGTVGRLIARRLQDRPELGLRPIGYLDTQPLPATTEADDLPILDSWDAERALREHGVGQVLVAFSTAPSSTQLQIIRDCNQAGIPVAFVPRLFEAVPADVEVEHLGGLPLVSLRPSNPRSWRFTLKYALDRIVVAVGLFFVWPLLAGAALAVWCSLGRPIFFRQERIGVDGRRFDMLKFRTMRSGGLSDDLVQLPDGIAPGGVEGEDRRTRVGRLLRRSGIDELPQLFNVLRGEMSLVGPRPERPEFVQRFEGSVYRYGDRHRVKAGITGWAQIAGLRGRTSVGDRVEWDNWYIENWTPWLDLKIILMTFAAVVRAGPTE